MLEILPSAPPIPKIIHQTYYKKTGLPAPIERNIAYLQANNPGWEYRLYDDADIEDFIRTTYGTAMLATYQRINPAYGAARADLFRYLLIYAEGGVYLDLKSTAIQPLDSVLLPDDTYILAQWDNTKYAGWGAHPELAHIPGGEFQQWHIISVPRHPFLYHAIQCVIRNIHHYHPSNHGVGFHGVIRTTGPIAYTLAIAPVLGQYPYRHVAIEQNLGIHYSIYDASSEDRNRNHRHLAKQRHYTELAEPIVGHHPPPATAAAPTTPRQAQECPALP